MSDHYGVNGDLLEKGNVEVKKRSGESSEALINRFLKEVDKSGIIEEYKKRMYYMKPSKKKRLARKKAERKRREGN